MDKYFTKPIDPELFWRAGGKVPYRLSNDYMFRAVMQEDQDALLSLVRAIIRPQTEEEQLHFRINALELLNPIMLGEAMTDKEFIMDIRLSLDNAYQIDVEMQVLRELYWPKRSLSYLCRLFDELNRGQAYGDTRKAAQISLLNYTLFEDDPKFYSRYLLTEQESGRIFSDKFCLYVVCFNQIRNASEVDRAHHLDQWARLFRAMTWEEVHMIVKENPDLEHVATVFYQASKDEAIRFQCEARQLWLEEQAARERYHEGIRRKYEDTVKRLEEINSQIAHLDEIITEKDGVIAEKEGEIAEKEGVIAEKEGVIAEKEGVIAEKEGVIAEKEGVIAEKEGVIAEKEEVIAEKEGIIAEKEEVITEKEEVIAQKDSIIASKNKEIEELKRKLRQQSGI